MATSKERKVVQRKLEEPVEKVLEEKLNDPEIATREGEKKATKELRKGVREATQKRKQT
jgi:hypothetical protein